MSIRTEFDLNIEEEEILRLLGYKDSKPEEKILSSLREEIRNCKTYIKPTIWSEKININSIEKDKVMLDNGLVFQGEFIANKLKGCSYIIVLVSTIGSDIDKVMDNAFDDGNYLKAKMADNIGTTSIGNIDKMFWNNLLDGLKGSNIGITQRLSPGDATWPINDQKKIFDCLKETKLDVKLFESSFMIPVKSTSAVYGFGEGIGITKLDHICSVCNMKSCRYRVL